MCAHNLNMCDLRLSMSKKITRTCFLVWSLLYRLPDFPCDFFYLMVLVVILGNHVGGGYMDCGYGVWCLGEGEVMIALCC